jgi:adenylosuccinate lyase
MSAPDRQSYQSPLSSRYASREMRFIWSDEKKLTTWRRLWIALAESEQALGLPISDEQLAELREHATDVDYDAAGEYEKKLRHDVMAHVHAWGDQCPKARGIIHLGATSCFVGDNTDLVQLRDAVDLVRKELVALIGKVRLFASEWRALPVLGYTHYQPAQATTLGKRACLWLQDLVDDLNDLEHAASMIRFRGVKGTTGTQASFLNLFHGDHEKVRELDRRVTEALGFRRVFGVTGQTYPRRLDFRIGQVLSGIAQSAHKFAVDLRLMSGRREVEEPFEANQIGSSAMPWKRNPMRSERICSLARYTMSSLDNLAQTASQQWFERTLDDSANRRIVLPEMFLSIDSILTLYMNVAGGMVVHEPVLTAHLEAELPFLASEALMMEAVAAGKDRQDVHEAFRLISRGASEAIHNGRPNPFRELVAADPLVGDLVSRFDEILEPVRHIGRAPEQVDEFLSSEVDPLLERYAGIETVEAEVRV